MRRFSVWLGLCTAGWAAPPGLLSDYPVHALTHAKIYVTPDRVLRDATLVVTRGKVTQVGEGIASPPGARVWDCTGKVVHAGFVEPFLGDHEAQTETTPEKAGQDGQGDRVDELRSGGTASTASAAETVRADQAERRVEEGLKLSSERLDKLRGLGILTVQVVPQRGILRGQGAIYSLKSDALDEGLVRAGSCQVIGLRTIDESAHEKDYPASLMGNLAFVRESFRQAQWAGQQRPSGAPPSWAALEQARSQGVSFYFEGRNLMEGVCLGRTLSALEKLATVWVTNPDGCLRPDWLQGKLVLTLDFPKLELHSARRPEISYLKAAEWRNAPELAARLAERKRPFCFSVHRLSDWSKYPQRLLLVKNSGLSESELLESLTRRPADWLGLGDRLGTLEVGKWASLVVRRGDPFALDGVIEQVWVEGLPRRVSEDHQHELTPALPRESQEYAIPPAWEGAGSVFVSGATVWTQGPAGCVKDCDVLVRQGKIAAIGPGLSAPAGVPHVDGRGKHLLPGLIDAHSHTGIVGDVNEGTLNVTAQVNIGDVIHPLDPNILRQLAGGVTCAHLLHGSANAIGGRTVTVKWRWGADAQGLLLQGAPPGVKFALGENPKQSNWGDQYTRRYPQTRQGVAALIRQRFQEALKYRQQQQAGLSPRPDEVLDTLLEILDGKRLVHCHSYRQDEILMLLNLAEELHFRVATLQHGLEAYKVADQVARHGAGVSTFSDWWAYKLEVNDAIPYNGALLHQRGVVAGFNSDSDELARRLLGEASKAIRYGGLSEVEALSFVTANPARQLGIERSVGSLELGKDGDMSLWSGSPFQPQSHCLETWVEGRSLYQSERYRAAQQELRRQRDLWLREAAAEVEP
ncbi:amidohydrolase family protein [bacterium]|nr:amidohydrolase family protein [bacterium]